MRRLFFLLVVVAVALPVSLAGAMRKEPGFHVYGDPVVVVDPTTPSPFAGTTTSDTFDVTGSALTFAASGFYQRHTVVTDTGVDFSVRAAIDCLNVTDIEGPDIAFMSGTITESSDPTGLPVGTSFFTYVSDDPVATISDVILGSSFTCQDPILFPALPPVTSGNVVIQPCDRINGSDKCKTKKD